jgi:hypothetical protein
MTSEAWERESRLSDNYSKVPHGLWTADLTYGAKCLLGWLHSHSSGYLATLTSRRIREEFGCSTVIANWITELSEAGFIEVVQEKNRQRFVLKAAPWDALATRSRTPKRSKIDQSEQVSETVETVENRAGNGRKVSDKRSKNDPIEDHVEDHLEEHSLAHASVSTTDDTRLSFEHWWGAYPRKVGKGAALKRWRSMSRQQRAAAVDALPRHVEHWRVSRTDVQFIPHPATWLSQGRWDDVLITEQRQPSAPSAVLYAAERLRQAQERERPRPTLLALDTDDWSDDE